MAEFRRTVRTTTTVVYELDAPANWTEVTKVFADIRNSIAGTMFDDIAGTMFDDIVEVHPMDDKIEIRIDAKWLKDDPAAATAPTTDLRYGQRGPE